MIALVGYTGFVGSNIYARARNRIEGVFDSKNIEKAYGLEPEVLIYAGLRAEKQLANSAPEKDLSMMLQACENIRLINPRKPILISTIDVYKNPAGVDENSAALSAGVSDGDYGVQPYGLNRYYFEAWLQREYPESLIIRLPALYGLHIRKSFIYDYINVIPSVLSREKLEELVEKDASLQAYYELQEDGFYQCRKLSKEEKEPLKDKFRAIGFTALDFTDSRSVYQFYPLSRLWEDIQTAMDADIRVLNLVTEPVSVGELYRYLTGKGFKNELSGTPARYDCRTLHAGKFGGGNGYICSKEEILKDIKGFVETHGQG
ncbi:MAG: NAD(P)-dependent oxidoreductase [Roseburia sp.]|nr:NAD(P)-dependent oxidoreductase [Roseburia sp.]